MKLTFLYGKWASAYHGKFNVERLYREKGLTGSESDFFNTAKGLAERGHDVEVHCDARETIQSAYYLGGARVRLIDEPVRTDSHAYLSWNEPDALRVAPVDKLKIYKHEINDFSYCKPGFENVPDIFVFLSRVQMNHCLSLSPQISRRKTVIGWNSLNLDFFNHEPAPLRDLNKLIYCSSPDRGLHVLLDIFPEIQKSNPDVSLHIFYEISDWARRVGGWDHPIGHRAKIITNALDKLEGKGVHLHGFVSNVEMARQLRSAVALVYPCEPTTFTEGFSIATIDAAAAGAIPIISDADALGSLYQGKVVVINGVPSTRKQEWISTVNRVLSDAAYRAEVSATASEFVKQFDRKKMCEKWEVFLEGALSDRNRLPDVFEPADPLPPQIPEGFTEVIVPTTLRLAMVYGQFSSQIHGPFGIKGLYETTGLTGSESFFFNTAKSLSERGHQIDVFCDVQAPYHSTVELNNVHVYPLSANRGRDYDAYLAWNEPDLLRSDPDDRVKICAQQLNDFNSYCDPGYSDHIDCFVFPSRTHRDYMLSNAPFGEDKTEVLPNTINLDFYKQEAPRREKNTIIWASSPDRGLHNLLQIFPLVRQQVPNAVLKIFYRFDPWYQDLMGHHNVNSRRARYINECLERLGRYGENGVFLIGQVPNKQMSFEMQKARVLAYTCDPLRFTEGFSVTIMDACAAGCLPIISDVDALADVYGEAAHIVPGRAHRPDVQAAWVTAICRALSDDEWHQTITTKAVAFSKSFDRHAVAGRWEGLIRSHIATKKVRLQKIQDSL